MKGIILLVGYMDGSDWGGGLFSWSTPIDEGHLVPPRAPLSLASTQFLWVNLAFYFHHLFAGIFKILNDFGNYFLSAQSHLKNNMLAFFNFFIQSIFSHVVSPELREIITHFISPYFSRFDISLRTLINTLSNFFSNEIIFK